jgi:guanyl-specific ribonuclease Sa
MARFIKKRRVLLLSLFLFLPHLVHSSGILEDVLDAAVSFLSSDSQAAYISPKTTDADDVVPDKARRVLRTIRETGAQPEGYYSGGRFYNREGRLPDEDSAGKPITYKEYDVNPYKKGVNRGAERLVVGSDGAAYYTSDHYDTFTLIAE